MIRFQFYNIVLLLFPLSAITLNTDLGTCELIIINNNNKIDLIEQTIIDYSKDVNDKFVPVTPSPFTINIVEGEKEFSNYTKGTAPEWSIAITKKNPNRIIMKAPKTARISFNRFLQVLIHELNHVYLNNVLKSYSFPSWFKEGMAMSESGEFSISHRVLISSAKWKGELLSINELVNFRTIKKHSAKLAYAESYAMYTALKFYYGNNIYKNIINRMNENYTFWESISYVTKDSEENIKNNIEDYVSQKYNWMFLLNAYNLIFIFLPLILISGYFYKTYKNKKLLRKWEIEELLEDLHNEKN